MFEIEFENISKMTAYVWAISPYVGGGGGGGSLFVVLYGIVGILWTDACNCMGPGRDRIFPSLRKFIPQTENFPSSLFTQIKDE